jgi:Tol biopolymer transport system component
MMHFCPVEYHWIRAIFHTPWEAIMPHSGPFRALVSFTLLACLLFTLGTSLSPQAEDVADVRIASTTRLYLPVVMRGYRPPIIPNTTHPLTEETTQHLVSVSQDGMVYTFAQMTHELERLQPGHVMVSDTSELAPFGFLRTVSSISTASGGEVHVETERATLEDAIQEGGVLLRRQLTPADVRAGYMVGGMALAQGTASLPDGFIFELEDVVLYDHDGNPDTTLDQIRANGRLELAPSFDFELLISNQVLQHMTVVVHAHEVAELEIMVQANVPELDAHVEVARLDLGTITVMVGSVPVVIQIEMPISIGAQGTVAVGVTTGVAQQSQYSAGVRYDGSHWQPVASLENDFDYSPPEPTGLTSFAEFRAYTESLLHLCLYGVAGPQVAARSALELVADALPDIWWQLYGELVVPVRVETEMLGRSLGEYDGVVINHRELLAQYGVAATTRVSVSSDGSQANSSSYWASISPSGRYVAFESGATNLIPGDMHSIGGLFLHDRQTREATRISVTYDGTQASGGSGQPSVSADGRYVAFMSWATNLVPGDTNMRQDIFVRDRQMEETTRVSVASDGSQANDFSQRPFISADGRYVVFESAATNLIPGDMHQIGGVFLHDRQTRETTRISITYDGTQANGGSGQPSVSADGRYVAFMSWATNLVPGDTNGAGDIFVHDRQTGQTSRVSVSSNGNQGNQSSYLPSISADGRYVAFASDATNLVPGDTNNWRDIFVHDLQNGSTTRVSLSADGTQRVGDSYSPSISADGRYVAYEGYHNFMTSILVYDRLAGETTVISVSSDGHLSDAMSFRPSISATGRSVAFESAATNLVPGDTNGSWDVFVRDRQIIPYPYSEVSALWPRVMTQTQYYE